MDIFQDHFFIDDALKYPEEYLQLGYNLLFTQPLRVSYEHLIRFMSK